MHRLVRRILCVVFVYSALIACEKEEIPSANSPIEFEDIVVSYSAIELELMTLVNNHRTQLGLTKLNHLGLISKEAENHSIYMVEQDSISHDNYNIRQKNLFDTTGAVKVGENVAYGYNTANALMNAWLNNAEHRVIIERISYTHFGISAKKNDLGRYYFTQIFIERGQ